MKGATPLVFALLLAIMGTCVIYICILVVPDMIDAWDSLVDKLQEYRERRK